MAPLARRQIIASLISEALQSQISTASTAFFGPTLPPPPPPVRPTPPVVPIPTVTGDPLDTFTPSSSAPITSETVSLITLTTTTDSVTSTTNVVTSTESIVSATPIPSLALTTPTSQIPVSTSVAVVLPTPSPSSTGVSAGAGTGSQAQPDKQMSGGIIALIVVGVLLATLLAGAFIFRRVQVHRRAKRRENNYGAGPIPDTTPFPFTNVSEADLKGAESIRDFRQGSFSSQNEKPLPSIAPEVPTYAGNYGQQGMSGPYPMMGAAAGYGYGQPGRTASPAPSQAPRTMSPVLPPAAVVRTGSPFSGPPAQPAQQYPQLPAPTAPAPTAPAPPPVSFPSDKLAPSMGGKKRVLQTFQPSLPDELDIREGDWVTVVHAYDDGWGLCDHNGRRGVVPLECLDLGTPDLRASRRLSSLSAIKQ